MSTNETMLVERIQRAEQAVDADFNALKKYDVDITNLVKRIAEVRDEYEKLLKNLYAQHDRLTEARERCATSMTNHMAELESVRREFAFGCISSES